MALWTDLITPNELTEAARASLEQIEQQKGSLATFLPSENIEGTTAEFTRTRHGLIPTAEYRSYDAEASIGGYEGGELVTLPLPPVSRKMRVGELDVLMGLAGRPEENKLKLTVASVAYNTVRSISERVEALRGQILETAAININENGLKITADLGRDTKMKVDASKKWDKEGDPITDLIGWSENYADENGVLPGSIIMSRQALSALQRNEIVRKAVGGVNTPTITTVDAINTLLTSYGLPLITLYDRKTNVGGTVKHILDPKKVFMLPEIGSGVLGSTVWGRTPESGDPQYSLLPGDQGGIVAGLHKEDDPYSYWVRANAMAMPVLKNPNASMVATVLT